MFNRLLQIDPKMPESVLIFGPRGTGKTFWLKQRFPDSIYFDLLLDATYTEFLGNPSILENRIPSDYKSWVIIDEVQKVPALLNEVHRLIENKKLRFILTGSSARSLRRKGTNLLAGRAFTYYMHPLTCEELQSKFKFDYSMRYGMLPQVYQTKAPEQYLSSYVTTYLKEEVQQEAITRNMPLFTRFLAIASFSQGEVLNYANIAREVGTNRQTIANFFTILDDLLLAVRLPVFRRRAKREMVAQLKFYYFDVGVYRTLRPKGPLDSEAELDGAAVETFFLQQVRALNDYSQLGYEIYYWRTRAKEEVDFILYGSKGLFAFEIKRKQKLSAKDFTGLSLFKEDYPMANCYLLYGGTRAYFEKNIKVVPYLQAISELRKLLS